MEMSGKLHAPCRPTPGVRAPGTHCRRGWVGPRADLDALAKRIEILDPAAKRTPVVQPVA